MKIVHRIITPILALGTIALGLFLKMFYFHISGSSENVNTILALVQAFAKDFSFNFEYSVYELINMFFFGGGSDSAQAATDAAAQQAATFMAVVEPVKTELTVFLVFLVIALVLLLTIAVISALGKRKTTIILSCAGLVSLFVSIVSSRIAFDTITNGGISLGKIISTLFENETIKTLLGTPSVQELIDTLVVVDTAILSGAFFAIFGMFLLIIFWTIFANMLIKTPIHTKRKHRRKLVIKKPSAYFQK